MTPEKAKAFLGKSVVQSPGINLQDGEVCYFAEAASAVIMKNQNIGTTYNRTGSGLYYKGLGFHSSQGVRSNVRGTVVDKYDGNLYLTSQRLVLVAYKGGFDLPLRKLTSLDFMKDGLMVTAEGKSYLVSTEKSKKLKEIIEANNAWYEAHPELLGGGSSGGARSAAKPAGETDAVSALKGYKELLDSGAITQEEYDLKKREILGVGSTDVAMKREKPAISVRKGSAKPKGAFILWICFVVLVLLAAFSVFKQPVQWSLAVLFGGLALGCILHLDPLGLRGKGKMLPAAATWALCVILALAGGLLLK